MDLRVPTLIKFLNRLKSGTAAGNKSYLKEDQLFRNRKDFAVLIVEFDRDVSGDFEVLLLILADRHQIALVDQDVRGHQHRIGEEAVVRREPLCDYLGSSTKLISINDE